MKACKDGEMFWLLRDFLTQGCERQEEQEKGKGNL